jgi:diguanylate cyclase (GGDEF)-like protein
MGFGHQKYMIVLEGLKTLRSVVRTAWIATLACGGLFVVGHLLRQLNIVVNPLVWSSAQIITALLSFTIAANVLVRYHGTGNRVSLLLGVTLAVSGIIHLIAILERYRHLLSLEENFRAPLSWMVGQTILGLMFLFAYAIDKHLPWPRELRRNIFAVVALIIAVSCMVAMAFLLASHAPPIHPQKLLARPWELLPGIIFFAAVFVLKRISDGDRLAFDAMLVWVAGINAAGHLIATQSARVLDAPGAAAQLLSTFGCVALLGATLLDNAQLFSQVRTLAISDSLTGLANYRRLVDVLQAELERSGRTNRSFSVLLMDLDRLKVINDRHGHLAGSRALCRVADILRLHCRSIDTAARYGGDEFALVLPETDEPAAQQVADRIRDRLSVDEEVPRLTLSVGLATFPQSGHSVQHLLEVADRSLYSMKEQSKSGKAHKPHLG